MFNRAGWLCVCHENSIPLANKKTGDIPRWSLSKLFADALFSLFRRSSGWKSGCRFLVACPPLLADVQPGVALRTSDLRVTFSGSSSPSVPSTACSLAQPHAPLPTAAPLGRALIGIIACSPRCCDSPVPWQGRPDLQGTYTLLHSIIDLYYHLFAHKPRPLCSQTTAPKVEWRQSSLSAAHTITPFAFFFFFTEPHAIVDLRLLCWLWCK